MTNEEAIQQIEHALVQRYNVTAISQLDELAVAVADARTGDVKPLLDAMTDREMYRWRVDAALAVLRNEAPVQALDSPAEPEPVAEEEDVTEDEEPEPTGKGRKKN